MCCCISFAEMEIETLPAASVDAHACCQLADETSSHEDSSSEENHECYHEELEASQFNDTASDGLSSSIVSVQQSAEYLDASLLYDAPQILAKGDFQLRSAVSRCSTGTSHSQKYCVFIL